ncbi:MAG TPA: hypothetical protein VFV00_13975 [Acidimicrobiales bacterium]|nr:hypothetical protein [Acidimicrobiales bacterium]
MRVVRALAVAGVLAVVATGCGSSGERVTIDATPVAMRKAAQATLDKGSSKIDLTMQMNVKGKDLTIHATGGIDTPHKQMQLDLDMPPLGHMTEILDGTVIYMQSPALAKAAAGKDWVKFDLAKSNSAFSDLVGNGSTGPLGSDPTSFLQFLAGAGKVTDVGTEDVRGVHTRHFSGSYTLNDALNSLPADRRQKAQDAFKALGIAESANDTPIPFDAWIGDDGLVRRISTTIDPSQFAANAKVPLGKVSMTMELYDIGQPVDITIPGDNDVTDVSNLVPKLPPSSSTS